MKRKRVPPPRDAVSASELAEMGVCERRVLLAQRHGTWHTTAQEKAMRRGLRAHERFHRDGLAVREAVQRRGRWISLTSWGRCLVGLCSRLAWTLTKLFGGGADRPRHPGGGR